MASIVGISGITTHTITVNVFDRNVTVEVPYEPEDEDNIFVWEGDDGSTFHIGMLLHDEDASNPLEYGGMGYIYSSHRHAGREEHQKFREAMQLDEHWHPTNELREWYVVPLDVYQHGNTIYSVSGDGPQCAWDTARGGAVWVPDKEFIESIKLLPDVEAQIAAVFRSAEAACEVYTNWCNGECYGYVALTYSMENLNDPTEDSCCGLRRILLGFYSREDALASLKETLEVEK